MLGARGILTWKINGMQMPYLAIFNNSRACKTEFLGWNGLFSRIQQHAGQISCGGGFWVWFFFKHDSIDFFGPIKAPWKRKTQPDRTVIISKNLKNRVLEHISTCYSNFIFGSDFHDQNLFLKRSEKLENNSAGTSSFWRFQGALIGRFRSVGSQDRPDKTCATIGSDLWELRKE